MRVYSMTLAHDAAAADNPFRSETLTGFERADALIVAGKVRVRPDKRALAIEAAERMAEATRREAGCREYRVLTDVSEPNTLFVFEVWDSVDAMIRHFQTAHMAEFQEQLKKVAAAEPEVKRYLIAA